LLGIILTAISFAIFVVPILIGISLLPDFNMMQSGPYL
jgi:hypothetical protein